jgi:hypothetical protein
MRWKIECWKIEFARVVVVVAVAVVSDFNENGWLFVFRIN